MFQNGMISFQCSTKKITRDDWHVEMVRQVPPIQVCVGLCVCGWVYVGLCVCWFVCMWVCVYVGLCVCGFVCM